MTLSSFLPSNPDYHPQPSFVDTSDIDRSEWNTDGWNGGKGNPNSVLSALTLLAFLFFLNILQSCLKDTIGTTPTVMVMMLNASTRIKRETTQDKLNQYKHLNVDSACTNWTDLEILNLVHNQVQSYWSSSRDLTKRTQNMNINFKKTNTDEYNYMVVGDILQNVSTNVSKALGHTIFLNKD